MICMLLSGMGSNAVERCCADSAKPDGKYRDIVRLLNAICRCDRRTGATKVAALLSVAQQYDVSLVRMAGDGDELTSRCL